jgi:hypothetical protein
VETDRIRNDGVDMQKTAKQSRKCLRIILDSNALFVSLQFRIDIFEKLGELLNMSFEPILLSPIRREIQRLAEEGSPKTRNAASYALKLAERCKLVETDAAGASPDDIIVKVAHELGCPVFTNDVPLRKRLRDINVPVIYLRQKSRLEIDGRL